MYVEAAPYLHRSASCPNLTFDVEPRGPVIKRKRANSENITLSAKDMLRIQSDTDLLGIDKEKTFTASAIVKPAELLARVVNVLGGFEVQKERGIHMFDDDQILATERPTIFSIGNNIISSSPKRTRALSVAVPNYRKESVSKLDHDYTWTNGDTAEKYRKEANMRSGKLSLPTSITPANNEKLPQPRSLFSRLFRKPSANESPAEYIKNTMKGRASLAQGSNENSQEKSRRGSMFPSFGAGEEQKIDESAYKEKTKRGRYSIFQMFDFNKEEYDEAKEYKEKTRRGRHSIFPSFDFSEDEDAAAAKAYQYKPKRHSIFPTFDFSEDEDSAAVNEYREKSRSGRHSIFPTFDFSNQDEDAKRYKEGTRRERHSIFPTFDFSNPTSNDEDDTVDEEEVQKYHNRTRKGRLSLFPTFGKSKKEDDDTLPESSDELVNYKDKTKHGRRSLFPSFGKDRKNSSPCASTSDLEASIKQYQKQTKTGRNSLFAGDVQSYRMATEGGRRSLFSSELDEYKNATKHSRPSLFDPDLDLSSLPESAQVEVLEQTSVADLLRALAALETASQVTNNTIEPYGTSDNGNYRRRGSVRPDFYLPPLPNRTEPDEATGPRRRRVSARAAAPQFTPTLATVVAGAELQITATAARENRMTMLNHPPPPYSENTPDEESQQSKTRRYSPAPNDLSRSTGPVPRLFSRIRKESGSSPESSSRRGSLTDIVIDSNKS